MTKIIITFFVIGYLTFITPVQEAIADPIPITKSPVVVKVVHKAVVKHNKIVMLPPTEKVIRIAERVALETSIPKEKVIKIIWAESRYDSNSINYNRNKTTDHGLFQINSS